MLEAQIGYVRQAVDRLARGDLAWVDVRADVQDSFNDEIERRIKASVWAQGCTSWYQTATGKNPLNWPGFTLSYRLRTRKFPEQHYELQPMPVRRLALVG
jgi:hypothetical protein